MTYLEALYWIRLKKLNTTKKDFIQGSLPSRQDLSVTVTLIFYNVLVTNEMHNSYNQFLFLFHSFLVCSTCFERI